MDNPDRLPHLARLAEAHDPEPTHHSRMPSGWWLLRALFGNRCSKTAKSHRIAFMKGEADEQA